MAVTSRAELIEYCLRELGHPVLEINISEDQLEDRVDEALQYYRDFHYDGVELVYLKEQITSNTIQQQYFTLSDAVIGVVRVLPLSSKTQGIDLFDVRYQILLNDLYSLQSTDLIYYTQVKTQLELINSLLIGQKPIRFNRHQNRLYVDMNWSSDVSLGDYIIVECYRALDPETFTDVYNDSFLKRYCAALFKRQWGTNLKKFEGVQLPGGVTLNGQKIYDEAIEEIEELRRDVKSTYQLPVDFFTG